MPIYEYFCQDCEKSFALLQQVGANEENTICSECNSKNVKKKFSTFSSASSSSSGFAPAASHGSGGA